MKRLFAAIKIHPDYEFLKRYQELKQALRHEQIKWVEEQNIHITLHFFGETEDRDMVLIQSVLGRVAEKEEPFRIGLSGLGIFGSSYSPRVIWARIEPVHYLLGFMIELKSALENAGFENDRQNIVPHLSLGRIKELKEKQFFQRMIGQFKDTVSIEEQIGEIFLFESRLYKTGPLYIIQKSFEFGKKNTPADDTPDSGVLQREGF
ncbi:MAG: RNA 2',3'-cyclic phosphodiesterase [Bacteroidota bacterium]